MALRYEKLSDEPIGATAWGNVYAGCDLTMDSDVEILELAEYYRRDPQFFSAIWTNVDEAKRLSHDFLTTTRDVVRERGWIVVEARGSSMREALREKAFSPSATRRFLVNGLELISYFQSRDFTHGDFSPESFSLPVGATSGGRLSYKLFFSLGASVGGFVPMRGRDMKYVAPEMLNRDFGEISYRSDMYVLAFVALEALVGPDFDSAFDRLNSTGDSPWVYWHGNEIEELPSVRELAPNVPPDLEAALTALLQKRASDRPETAEEALRLLDSTKSDEEYDRVATTSAQITNAPTTQARTTSSKWGVDAFDDENEEQNDKIRFDPQFLLEWGRKQAKKPYSIWTVCALAIVAVLSCLPASFRTPIVYEWTDALAVVPPGAEVKIVLGENPDGTLATQTAPRRFDQRYLPTNARLQILVEAPGYESKVQFLKFSKKNGALSVRDADGADVTGIELPEKKTAVYFIARLPNGENAQIGTDAYVDGESSYYKGSLELSFGKYEVAFFPNGMKPTRPTTVDATSGDETASFDVVCERLEFPESQDLRNERLDAFKFVASCLKPEIWEKYDPNGRKKIWDSFFSWYDAEQTVEEAIAAKKRLKNAVADSITRAVAAALDAGALSVDPENNDWKAFKDCVEKFKQDANFKDQNENLTGYQGDWRVAFWEAIANAQDALCQYILDNEEIAVDAKGEKISLEAWLKDRFKFAKDQCDVANGNRRAQERLDSGAYNVSINYCLASVASQYAQTTRLRELKEEKSSADSQTYWNAALTLLNGEKEEAAARGEPVGNEIDYRVGFLSLQLNVSNYGLDEFDAVIQKTSNSENDADQDLNRLARLAKIYARIKLNDASDATLDNDVDALEVPQNSVEELTKISLKCLREQATSNELAAQNFFADYCQTRRQLFDADATLRQIARFFPTAREMVVVGTRGYYPKGTGSIHTRIFYLPEEPRP